MYGKEKKHIENLILAMRLCCKEYVEKENMGKKRPCRKERGYILTLSLEIML